MHWIDVKSSGALSTLPVRNVSESQWDWFPIYRDHWDERSRVASAAGAEEHPVPVGKSKRSYQGGYAVREKGGHLRAQY